MVSFPFRLANEPFYVMKIYKTNYFRRISILCVSPRFAHFKMKGRWFKTRFEDFFVVKLKRIGNNQIGEFLNWTTQFL